MLGEFEYLLITAAAGLGDEAYGSAIREEIEATSGRKCIAMEAPCRFVDRGQILDWIPLGK
jgi:hypothetical protein